MTLNRSSNKCLFFVAFCSPRIPLLYFQPLSKFYVLRSHSFVFARIYRQRAKEKEVGRRQSERKNKKSSEAAIPKTCNFVPLFTISRLLADSPKKMKISGLNVFFSFYSLRCKMLSMSYRCIVRKKKN